MKKVAERLQTEKLISSFRSHLDTLPDPRSKNNTSYACTDFFLAAFSLFYLQNPSFLSFQESLKSAHGKHNLHSLFGSFNIPSTTQIRTHLDPYSPTLLFPYFHTLFQMLLKSGLLKPFLCFQDGFLLALDGVQYFSSSEISCKNCSLKEHKNGDKTYSHSMVTPTFVAPSQKEVLALAPEFITPQDGHEKQDCEIEASKRWIQNNFHLYKEWGITVLGDDLYSRTPFIHLLKEVHWNFILVCKPTSHESLFNSLNELEELNEITTLKKKKLKGKRFETETYCFYNGIALYETGELIGVNFCELVVTNEAGKELYKNSWVTNLEITKKNVESVVEAGRGRWKIENENNNTLKTKGYHLEHNFGHGKKNLAALLATLNILAFLFHTILELLERKYQILRIKLSTRSNFFEHLKVLTCHHYYESWEHLFCSMLKTYDLDDPDSS